MKECKPLKLQDFSMNMNTINNDVNHHEEGLVESSSSDFSDDSSDERLSIAMNDTKDAPVVSNLPLHQTERKQYTVRGYAIMSRGRAGGVSRPQ